MFIVVQFHEQLKMEIQDGRQFKPFKETYRYCFFALAISLFYPNKNNVKQRIIIIILLTCIHSFMLSWFFIYTIKCLLALDLFNTARNITLGVLISLYFIKFFYSIYKTKVFCKVFDKISSDLDKANTMNGCCQEIVKEYIKKAKVGEIIWIFIPILLTAQFPLYAAVRNAYYTLISDEIQRVMVHETDLMGIEDKQYETPYFEVIFAYNSSQAVQVGISFIGFDGSFCIASTHLRLKLKLLVHKMNAAFNRAVSRDDLKTKLKEIIRGHQEVLEFHQDLQNGYGGWMFMIFGMTSITMALNLYLIYVLQKMDPKYVTFTISCIIHMLTPCYYSSQIIKASEETAVDFFCVNWEKWEDNSITKILIFMIARAQQPMVLTGMGVVYFDMQLFISVMQFSYSFFTLITN
ncbi:odorant receptor 4-like [Aricia agestis]|uniref:odorant receptor 4-like n=1 Tax=Aricia agestis TaxID=91739 RepID=UPI001C207E3B|nr:odorant receptor 4-like [Aricia agestis]